MALTKVTGQVIKNTTDVTVGVLTVTNTLAVGGTVSIGGTLTYEDVTNVDAVGLITARNGIVVGSGITLSKDGDIFATGVTTSTTFVGNLTGTASANAVLTGSTNDTLVTVTGSNAIQGESNLTFNSSNILTASETGTGNGMGGIRAATASGGGNAGYGFVTNDANRFAVTLIGSAGAESLRIYDDNNDAERLRIASDGNVEIGGGTHSRRLAVHDTTNSVILIEGASNGTSNLMFGDENDEDVGMLGYNHGSNYLAFTVNAAERLRITSGGDLLLGTTTAAVSGGVALMIADSAGGRIKLCDSDLGVTATDGFELIASDNGTAYVWNRENMPMLFGTNNTEKLRIDSSGNIIVNDTTADGNVHPDTKLHVKGGITFRELTSASEGALPAITQWSSDGVGQDLAIGTRSAGGDVLFFTGNTGTDGDWGDSSNAEKLRITADGLTFNGDTAAANALDDYEEGTYTPVVYYDSVNNHTYSEQVGTYTKIGNFCFGYIVLTWDEQASSGQVGFSLPFTSSNISGTRTSGYFIYQDGLNIPSGQGSTHLILYGGQNASSIYAYFTGSTNNSELGTSPTQLTNSHTSSHNTTRMVFHYRTA